MANYQIPLSYVVNVSVLPSGRGLEPLQLGTILILTDDEPVTPLTGDYIISRTASSVSSIFGTESTTTAMVNAIFSQNPNILNASGYVVVAPYTQTLVSYATAGTFTTPDISANIGGFASVTDGELTIIINGVSQTLTGLDFSGVTTLEGVASILQTHLLNVTVSVSDNAIVFTSNSIGATSSVVLDATSNSSGTDLYSATYLIGIDGTSIAGVDAVYTPETTSDAIARLSEQIYTEGILTTRNLENQEAIAASNVVEAMPNNILFLTDVDLATFSEGGLFYSLRNNKNTRKLLYLTGDNPIAIKSNANVFAAAFASRGLSVNYAAPNSTLTMTYKDLTGVITDTNINETILAQCEQYGADVYCSIEGLPKILSFKQGGLYFDELTNQIWLRTTVQTTVANVLFTTRTKIPQTTQGVNTLVNAVNGVLNQGVINGMIAAGEWNSPDTFGVYEDFMRSIRTQGYYVYFVPLAEQSQADREARKCPVINIAVKQAGALEHANVIIYVES